jgi:NTE family protein
VGCRVKSLGKVIRSVRAFGRELSRLEVREPPASKRPRIGLALGGGFARGIAHLGVLRVLEEENIPIDFVAGTSVGALVGAIYCSGAPAAEMERIACRVRFRDFARWTISRYGFASNHRMVGFLNRLLQVKTFEELQIPLAVAATDFATGEGALFHSGSLVDPIRASCAYPGMFLPVNIRGRLLVDGMLAYPVPAAPLREMGATHVIAVHLKGRWDVGGRPRHLFDVIGQCFAIAQDKCAASWRSLSDVVVEPDVDGFEYDEFDRTAELLRAGEVVMRAALPQVRSWLQPQSEAAAPAKPSLTAGLPIPRAEPAASD